MAREIYSQIYPLHAFGHSKSNLDVTSSPYTALFHWFGDDLFAAILIFDSLWHIFAELYYVNGLKNMLSCAYKHFSFLCSFVV